MKFVDWLHVRRKHKWTSQIQLALFIALTFVLSSCAKVQSFGTGNGEEAVQPNVLHFVTTSFSPAIAGQSYSTQLVAAGGYDPYVYTIESGTLPPPLSVDPATGAITGVVSGSASGTYTFTAQVTDAQGGVANKGFSIKISTPISINTTSLSVGQPNVAYIDSITATGGSGTYTSYEATGLPTGITISSTTGIVSGTTATSGVYPVQFVVTDSDGLQGSKTLNLTINTPPSITTATVSNAASGVAYSQTISGTDGQTPYTFDISTGSLPAGLTISSGGVISGTPSYGANIKTGTFNFTVRLTDSVGQTASQAYSMSVALPPKIATDTVSPYRSGAVGISYLDRTLVRGGVGALSYSGTNLPAGLSINATSGFISGTPTGAGTFTPSITVTDANGYSDTVSKTIKINSSGLSNIRFSGPKITPYGQYNSQWPYPYEIDIGDLDGDGIDDVVWTAYNSNAIIVNLGNGDGTFSTKTQVDTGGYNPWDVFIVDVDGDTNLDVVVTSQPDNRVIVMKGDGAWTNGGAITTQVISTIGSDIRQSSHGDLNGDGLPDIAIPSYGSNYVTILFNCGSGTTVSYGGNPTQACSDTGQTIFNFHKVTESIANRPNASAIADMNNDGNRDLIVTTWQDRLVHILPGTGDGTFGASASLSVGNNPYRIRIAEMNGDAFKDAVVITNQNTIFLAANNGSGGFSGGSSYSNSDLGGNGLFLDVGDVDGDGDNDVVSTNFGANRDAVALWFNNGTGTLTGRQTLHTGYRSAGIRMSTGLISGATRPGLAVATGHWVGWSRLVVFENTNTSSPYTTGKYFYANPPNSDVAIYGSPAVGDINGDGIVDILAKTGGAASVLIGNGSADFSLQATSIPTGETSGTWWLGKQTALTDFNGDGYLDYVSANWNNGGTGTASVFMGNGDGTFGSQTSFAVNTSGCTSNLGTRSVDTGDINRDGKVDLVLATGCSSSPGAQVYIYYGYGDGTFNTASPKVLAGHGSYADNVLVIDADGDGKQDLVVANNDAWIQIHKGDGAGNFSAPAQVSMGTSGNIAQMDFGDFNGDGIFDYVATPHANSSWALITGGASATINSVSTFSGLANEWGSFNSVSIAAVDWNQDGKLDVIWSKQHMGGLQYFKGNGLGGFTTPTTAYLAPNPSAYHQSMITIFDIDGDGLPDIVNGNGYNGAGSSIGISLNDSN